MSSYAFELMTLLVLDFLLEEVTFVVELLLFFEPVAPLPPTEDFLDE